MTSGPDYKSMLLAYEIWEFLDSKDDVLIIEANYNSDSIVVRYRGSRYRITVKREE